VADTSEATVIVLDSHPAWIAAQRRARERAEAMLRHPSCQARRRAAAGGNTAVADIRRFAGYSSSDTPA